MTCTLNRGEPTTRYNDGTGCCNLTDRKGPGHSFVHRQPRHSLMIFAEPMLTADELQYLDPEYDPRINTSDAIAYAPKGDVSTFLENVKNTTKEVLYFRPGVRETSSFLKKSVIVIVQFLKHRGC